MRTEEIEVLKMSKIKEPPYLASKNPERCKILIFPRYFDGGIFLYILFFELELRGSSIHQYVRVASLLNISLLLVQEIPYNNLIPSRS